MEFLRVDPPGCDLAFVRSAPRVAPRNLQRATRATTLVFLHGLGGAAASFAQALEAGPLAHFEVVLPDLLGHGSSDKPLNFDYRPASHAAVLFQALRKMGLEGHLHLVGHSMGAAVAVELARFPLPTLDSLVLVEPALDASRMRFAETVAAVPEGEFRARYAQVLEPYAAPEAGEADRQWAETAAFASSTAFHRSAKGALEAARRGELIGHLREIKAQASLIVSKSTFDEWTFVRDLEADGVPVFVVPAPDGMPMYECPDDFYAAVGAAIEARASR